MSKWKVFLLALLSSLLIHAAILTSGLIPEQAVNLPPDTKLRKLDVQMQSLTVDNAAEEAPEPDSISTALVPSPAAPKPQVIASPTAVNNRKEQAHKYSKPAASAPLATHILADTQPEMAASAPITSVQTSTADKTGPHPTINKATTSAPVAASTTSQPTKTAHQTDELLLPSLEKKTKQEGNDYIFPPLPIRHFPQTATLHYQGFYNGIMAGSGDMQWKRSNGHYELNIRFSPIFGPDLRYHSAGKMIGNSLQPDMLLASRGSEKKESARFDYDNNQLHYGDNESKTVALQTGAQDIFSLAFQLGLKGGKLGSSPLQITTGKQVYNYPMAPRGETDYITQDGNIRVIVFQAKGDDDLTEFWLAPDFANLAVRIVRMDSKKKIELRADLIEVNGKQQWKLSPPPPTRGHH